MRIVDNIAHGLYLDISKIPGAGVGLFTSKQIPAGVPVCEYKGDVFEPTLEWQDLIYQRYNYTLEESLTGVKGLTTRSLVYTISHTPSGKIIDSSPMLSKEVGMGCFANDAENWNPRENRPEELTLEYWNKAGYNTYYWHLENEVKLFLMSFKTINPGEEILVDYGDGYWETQKTRNIEIEKLKKKLVTEQNLLENQGIGGSIKNALKNAERKNEQT